MYLCKYILKTFWNNYGQLKDLMDWLKIMQNTALLIRRSNSVYRA